MLCYVICKVWLFCSIIAPETDCSASSCIFYAICVCVCVCVCACVEDPVCFCATFSAEAQDRSGLTM